MKTYVGIDIGACYIKAAKFSPQLKRVQPVKLNMNIAGSFALPSAILYDKINGEVEVKVNDAALTCKNADNKILRLTPKLAQKNWRKFIPNLDREISADAALKDLFVKIWRNISNQAARDENFDVTLTVPAAFSEVQRKKIRHAAICADVPISTIVTEPFAEIFADEEISQSTAAQIVFVFDFGATTLDATIFQIKRNPKSLDVKQLSAGTLTFGGVNIDDSILKNIFATKYPSEVKIFGAELERLITAMKEEIFFDEEEISNGTLIDGRGKLHEFELTREEIFSAIELNDVKEKIISLIDEVLDDAGIFPEEVTAVKVFGGTAAVDYFTVLLEKYFDVEIFDAEEIEREDLTLGAAIGAVKYRHLTDEENLRVKSKTVVPCGIYIQRGEKFLRCIKRNELRGFVTPYKPILVDELKKNKWRVSLYQSFCNEIELTAEGSAVFIGDIQLDSTLYESTQAILFKMHVDAAGQVCVNFFEDRKVNGKSKIVFVEEKILGEVK